MKIQVALYGSNGHQLDAETVLRAGGVLRGVCGIQGFPAVAGCRVYDTLQELAADPEISLVCVCAPKRSEQFEALRLLISAGKHVLAEKPCVMEEAQLDELLELAALRGVVLYEMCGSFLESPYFEAAALLAEGAVGEPVQILVQKSYPYADWRPQDEALDGGLILQNAVYGIRFVEHVVRRRVRTIQALQTGLGNPRPGGLQMACTLQMTLENGGLASVCANYLNVPSVGVWGNEELRVFGTGGLLCCGSRLDCVEVCGPQALRRVPLRLKPDRPTLFESLVHCLETGAPLPMEPAELLRPTRLAIRARKELPE